jgi:hypothetical protein
MAFAWESPGILDMASLLRKINHEETKSTKVFSDLSSFPSFLRG